MAPSNSVKPLIAIQSCHADRSLAQVQRETWLAGIEKFPIDYRFFLGRPIDSELLPDEIALDCPDDYYSLPFKTQATLKWALEHAYTHIYKCDTDTYVDVGRLLASGFEQHSYTGYFAKGYIHGGPGYWTDAKAAQLIVAATPTGWAEDVFVWSILRDTDAVPYCPDERYHMEDSVGPRPDNDVISLHVLTRNDRVNNAANLAQLKPVRMREAHARRIQ